MASLGPMACTWGSRCSMDPWAFGPASVTTISTPSSAGALTIQPFESAYYSSQPQVVVAAETPTSLPVTSRYPDTRGMPGDGWQAPASLSGPARRDGYPTSYYSPLAYEWQSFLGVSQQKGSAVAADVGDAWSAPMEGYINVPGRRMVGPGANRWSPVGPEYLAARARYTPYPAGSASGGVPLAPLPSLQPTGSSGTAVPPTSAYDGCKCCDNPSSYLAPAGFLAWQSAIRATNLGNAVVGSATCPR